MIEINLLPPQYRTVERTPLPVFLGVIGALVVLGSMIVFLGSLNTKTRHLKEEQQRLTAERDKKAKEVEAVRAIERELADAQGRIDTVLGIAETKIFWSQKLDLLPQILRGSSVWIQSVALDQKYLTLTCSARGSDLRRYTDLRQRFRNNTNFITDFDTIPYEGISIVSPGPQYVEPKILTFGLKLPLH